jgi:hypothetical protein
VNKCTNVAFGCFVFFLGSLGALDGAHGNIKISKEQHDSYVDRYLSHSINIMTICTAKINVTYTFVGFPGSAHNSRVNILHKFLNKCFLCRFFLIQYL